MQTNNFQNDQQKNLDELAQHYNSKLMDEQNKIKKLQNEKLDLETRVSNYWQVIRTQNASLEELKFSLEDSEQALEKAINDKTLIEANLNQVSEELKQNKQLDLKNCNDVEATIKKFEEQISSLKTQLSQVKKDALKEAQTRDQFIKTLEDQLAKRQPKDLAQAPPSRLRTFVLPIGLFLAALLGMGAGVAFSNAIKNLLAVFLQKA